MSAASALVAAIQLNSGDDEDHNWDRVQALARRARERGAKLVAFPENLLYEGRDAGRRQDPAEWGERFSELARELEVTLVAGSLREPAGELAYNTALAYGPQGQELARYRKIHLFDVDAPGGPRVRESSYLAPGDPEQSCVFEAPGVGPVGIVICYDLRFPELFRRLVEAGARTIVVPASFALGTGKDHWLTLLQARAIENQVFVIAPDQFGLKPNKRSTFGKSCVIDPWGSVLAMAREADEDVVVAELDFAHQDRIRAALPCLAHRRLP